jgi:MATE family multidrug resistance protein
MWCVPSMLTFIKQDASVILHAKPFFYSLAWTMLPMNIMIVIQQFLIGTMRAKLVMLMSIITVPIEIGFYYAFLFGKFGLPKIGLAGIGYGLTISYCAIVTCFICYLYFSKSVRTYNLFRKWWVINHRFLSEILYLGVPLGFAWCSELIFFAAVASMMGAIGVVTLAAYQISDQYLMIALIILYALSQNVTIRMGSEVYCNDRDKLKLIVVVNLMICLLLVSIFSMIYIVFPKIVISLDLNVTSELAKN